MNLEGNGSSWSVQIHTEKKGKEEKRPFDNWVVSVLKRVKILEIKENYTCKQFFWSVLQRYSLCNSCRLRTNLPPVQGHGAKTVLWTVVSASDWLVPLYGLTMSGLPKCLHWVFNIFNSYSRIFSAGWLERKCICKWGFCTFLLWRTLQERRGQSGSPWHDFETKM